MTPEKNFNTMTDNTLNLKTKEVSILINEKEVISGVLSIPRGYNKGTSEAVTLRTARETTRTILSLDI